MYEKIQNEILSYFPSSLENIKKVDKQCWNVAQEIRIRTGQQICIRMGSNDLFIDKIIDTNDIVRIVENFSGNSIYSVQSDINQGYITIKGGHRIGITGTTVTENNNIKNIKYISSLNIRIAREVKECSNEIFKYILKENEFENTIIISPPGCGKTTILRDMIRKLSNGFEKENGKNIGVVDERSEIAAMYRGKPQNDMGIRTDIINNCLKSVGIRMMIRSMGPQIIATDEIGGEKDKMAVYEAVYTGVKLLLTAHGNNINDIPNNMLSEKIFKNIVVLSNNKKPGEIKNIYKLKEEKYVACC